MLYGGFFCCSRRVDTIDQRRDDMMPLGLQDAGHDAKADPEATADDRAMTPFVVVSVWSGQTCKFIL